MSHAPSTVRGRILTSVVSLAVLAVLAVVAGAAVFSGFSSTQASGTNQFTAGTVVLSTNGTGSVLFNLPNMKPGDSASRCVEVTYNGTLPAGVQMYGTESGALAPFLTAQITRGTFPGQAPPSNSCTGFAPDSVGQLWSGTIGTLPGSGNPVADPSTWDQGAVHDYMITVSLPDGQANLDSAEGQSAQASFTWQAQNQ